MRNLAMMAATTMSQEWTPKNIPGLRLWLDAHSLTGIAEGAAVSQWNDKSGYGNHVTQSDAALKPTYALVSGKPAVRFSGSNLMSVANNSSIDLQAPLTIVAVARCATINAYRAIIAKMNSWYPGVFNNAGLRMTIAGKNDFVSQWKWTAGQFSIVTVVYDTDLDFTYYADRKYSDKKLSTTTATVTTDPIVIGSRRTVTVGDPWDSDILEILLYSGQLTKAQILQLHEYLSAKWQVARNVLFNASNYLTIPTFDSSSRVVHPDVHYWAAGQFGHKYWMAVTPYSPPFEAVENPSIFVSEDGVNWSVPTGLTNPIVPYPGVGNGYNADAHLLLGQDGKFYVFYKWTEGEDLSEKTYVTSSVDGITWGAPTEILSGVEGTLVCPIVIWDGSQYVMWTVNRNSTPNYTLWRRTCATPDGVWSAAAQCTVSAPSIPGPNLWHPNIILDNGTYYGVFCYYSDADTLCYATSADGITWTVRPNPILTKSDTGNWDDGGIYESTIVKTADGFDLWYSAHSADNNSWRMAGPLRFVP